jgi:folate-binding protein YgfZ
MLNHHVVVEILSLSNMFFLESLIKIYKFPSIFIESNQNIFRMKGKDAISFLDRISTNKIEISSNLYSSKTVLTNNKGSIIDVLKYKILDSENIIFTFNSDNIETINHLNKYIILDDIEISLEKKVIKLLYFIKNKNIPFELINHSCITNLDKSNDYFRYELFIEKSILDKIFNFNSINNLSQIDKNCLDIYMKFFDYKSSLSKINPLETGFQDSISFDKGCYVGQEVIARLHNYNKVSREIIHFKTNEIFNINDSFKNQNKVSGKILSIEKNFDHYVGLCLIKKKDIIKLKEEFIFI